MNYNQIPTIYLEDPSCLMEGLFSSEIVEEYDIFFRRVIEIASGDEVEKCIPIVTLLDEFSESYLYLDTENTLELLKRSLKYFEWIEEYMTCKLVLDLINEATLIR